LLVFTLSAVAAAFAWWGVQPLPSETMSSLDVTTRNLAARGREASGAPLDRYAPVLARCTLVFVLGTIGMAVGRWRRAPGLGVGIALATMVAFLPVAAEGMTTFARARSATTVVDALTRAVAADDLIVHEGPLENTASLLLRVRAPIHVVDGLQSNL